MGKSTILKFLFLSALKTNQGIPILIELRKLSKEKTILDHIYSELNPIDAEFDSDFILKLIKKGDFIFFFDGFDEIPLSDKKEVIEGLQNFYSKADNNFFILTSRPESALASFPEFFQANINPLKTKEAYELLRKYDSEGVLAEEIISQLKGSDLENIGEFLENPFLVSLLYKAYEHKAIIPLKKHIFYRQVYDALFEAHDASKGGAYKREKLCKLDSDDFHRVLRVAGLITVKKGQVEYNKDEILYILKKSKEHCLGVDFKEADFLNDLLYTVSIFNSEGNYYRWAHKSIQEYFAARYICEDAKDKQLSMLRDMYKSENYHLFVNILDLCYDMDYKSFRFSVIRDVLTDFIQYYKSSYNDIDSNVITKQDIDKRRELSYPGTADIFLYLDSDYDKFSNFCRRSGAFTNMGYPLQITDTIDNEAEKDYMRFGIVIRCNPFCKGYLLRMLAKKGCLYIKKTNSDCFPKEKWGFFSEMAASFDFSDGVTIDDAPDSIWNNVMYFSSVNNMLEGTHYYYFDYGRSVTELVEIEEEMRNEKNDELILGGF